MKISSGTIARTIVLIVALINQVLTVMGKNPLPWSDEAMFEGASTALTAIASIISWWKNNSFTSAAIAADEYKEAIKAKESEVLT